MFLCICLYRYMLFDTSSGFNKNIHELITGVEVYRTLLSIPVAADLSIGNPATCASIEASPQAYNCPGCIGLD